MEGNGDREVVHWKGFDSSDFERSRVANATLIVRAVNSHADLLDALKTARKFVVSSLEALVTGVDFDPAEHVVVKKIDAAIAKAEGTA